MPRAPLFPVSLAFALGGVLALDGWVPFWCGMAALILFGVIWWRARGELAALGAFYLLVASAGLLHTILCTTTIPALDLRRLPEEKFEPTTQWRGRIVQEPVAQASHLSTRAAPRANFIFRVEAWRPTGGRYIGAAIDAPWEPARGDVSCTLAGPVGELQCGDRVEMAAALEAFPRPLVPGALDLRQWFGEQGVYFETAAGARNWRRTEAGSGNFWANLSYRARDWAYGRLQLGLEDDPRVADFLAGMLIGYRKEIPADIEQDFRRTGTLHVFAVSGQNVAELMVVAVILLQLFGFVRWRWAWALTPVVLVYCLLTGAPASAIRATMMILVVLLAWRLGRPLNALGCWSLAFLGMMIWNPAILLDPGAQLSFGVVLGLILIGPPLARMIARPFAHDPFLPYTLLSPAEKFESVGWARLSQIVGAAVAALLVSEPIAAIDFHQITPISVFANLIVVPMAGLITIVGTMAVTVSLVTTTWAGWLNNANWLFAKLLIGFVGFLAHEPGASINVADVRAFTFPQPELVVAPLQDSACLFVRTPGASWLVNCGREAATGHSTAGRLLQFYGVNRLDGLILAQLGVADNGGAEAIVRDFHPRRMVVPALATQSPLERTIPDLVAMLGHPVENWARGQSVELAPGLNVEALSPDAAAATGRADDRALVLLFHWQGHALLWAGRGDAAVRQQLAAQNVRADLLVLDRRSGPDEAWLEEVGVREWLQFPVRDRALNVSTPLVTGPRTWPLEKTGAVEIHAEPGAILLRPWAGDPAP